MVRVPVGDWERRAADAEFRAHMQEHLDRLDREFQDFRGKLDDYHRENQARFESLERSAQKADLIVDEWMGGDDPDGGMRRALRQLISERRLIGVGWKVLAAFGAIGTAIIAGWQTVAAFVGHK